MKPLFDTNATIVKVIRHASDTVEHTCHAPDIARNGPPGQFVQLRVTDATEPLLRRPISILDADPVTGNIRYIFKVVGKGTALLARQNEGGIISISGPHGNGFSAIRDKRPVMVAGGYGIAPVLFLARRMDTAATLVYGARTAKDLLLCDEIESVFSRVVYTTDDGSRGAKGMVDTALDAELRRDRDAAVYACGPLPMLAAVAKIAADHSNVPCQVSMEKMMACGVSVCGGCAIRVKNGSIKTVCTDGPVFDGSEIDFNSTF